MKPSKTPDRPVIDPDEPEVSETENNYMSFAYEDIWPSGGDYDLNDVIIEYHRSITFNKDNYVSEVKETYEPVQKGGCCHEQECVCRTVCHRSTRRNGSAIRCCG